MKVAVLPVFPRRRRVNLGSFAAPEERTPAPLSQIIDEGVMITVSAVRMVVKNRLLVGAIRDQLDFDPVALCAVAHTELQTLAAQNEDSAARLEEHYGGVRDVSAATLEHPENDTGASDRERRKAIYISLAAALNTAAEDDELVATIVNDARDDALQEIARAVENRLEARSDPSRDDDYAEIRPGRLRDFLEFDLATLAAEREYPLEVVIDTSVASASASAPSATASPARRGRWWRPRR